jgi:hypothetical protein
MLLMASCRPNVRNMFCRLHKMNDSSDGIRLADRLGFGWRMLAYVYIYDGAVTRHESL